MNRSYCQYVKAPTDDSGIEALRLFLPTSGGYVNYNIVHSVMERSKCDTWRLSAVYYCDDNFERVRPLTRSGAEWEMALKINGRPDFIGGYAHGDEVFLKTGLTLDGEAKGISELSEKTAFDELVFEVWSVGYDPLDSKTESLLHYKKLIVSESGIRVEQRVEWLKDYELHNCFMAMMPPFKNVTDHYYTDLDRERKPINLPTNITSSGSFDTLYLCGEAGFTFSLKVEKYLSDVKNGNTFYISDNGGVPYNKMYFPMSHGGGVKSGEVWETVTIYAINF